MGYMKWLSRLIRFYYRKLRIAIHFIYVMRKIPNLKHPVSNSEKTQYRKLFGNHAFYALLADKYRVRKFVAERVGEKYLIPLLASFDQLTVEAFDGLPDQFIIKCNNGCKWNRIVRDKSVLDVSATVHYFNKQCQQKYSRYSGERHYDFIKPKIIVEKLLDDHGEPPWDYCIFSYHGKKGFDCAITISSPDMSFCAHFDRDWNLWETNFTDELMKKYVKPKNWKEMIHVARLLSEGIDFVRVDLYNIDGNIYFGEMTCTPASGLGCIKNKFRERMRSEMWELAVDDRRLYQKRGCIAD